MSSNSIGPGPGDEDAFPFIHDLVHGFSLARLAGEEIERPVESFIDVARISAQERKELEGLGVSLDQPTSLLSQDAQNAAFRNLGHDFMDARSPLEE